MNQLFISTVVLFLVIVGVFQPRQASAQATETISYQTVVRDASGTLINSGEVGMKISILKGSVSGTVVYEETQTPQVNMNGLVNIELGGGATVGGDFSAIDWSNGPYFIHTEMDAEGADNYTVFKTSQLLSVPYAMQAGTAETISGSEKRYIGEFYGGGIIVWLDHTGEHGLIMSLFDLATNQTWGDQGQVDAYNPWDGAGNTSQIIAVDGHATAAGVCEAYVNADYGTGVYNDWYLPSLAEMNHLWTNFYPLQKALDTDGNSATTPLTSGRYWTSTETNNKNAYSYRFHLSQGSSSTTHPEVTSKFYNLSVRAFRAF